MNIYKNLTLNGDIVDIVSESGKIVKIGKTDLPGEDFSGCTVKPGLIEIHSHGAVGYDTMDARLEELSVFQAQNGVTAFYPTTMTESLERIKNVCDTDITKVTGAKILGFHMEGPYINVKYKGAQNEKYIKSPDIKEFNSFENIKIVTVAPETENAMDFIKECNAKVCLGHSDADYDTAIKAMENGADCLTHTLNAMTPLHHRNPGIVAAAADKNIYIQVICDGLHIHPSMIRILYKLFGSERMILISDSMKATKLSDGKYEFGGQDVFVDNGIARTADGAIAGSTKTLFDCVQSAIKFGIPEDDAYKMASQTPAEYMNIKKGKLEAGYDCDLLILNSDGTIRATIIEGVQFKN